MAFRSVGGRLLAFAGILLPFWGACTQASIVLTSPEGGEAWSVGSKHFLTWKADQLAATARIPISFSSDGGKTWAKVPDAVPGTSNFLWRVPNAVSTKCHIRIASGDGPATANQTAFSITPSQEVTNYQWTNVTRQAAFAPRDGAGAVVFQGKMWLLGGWNPHDKTHFPRICNNEVWSSKDGAAWVLEKPNTFLDRSFDGTQDWEGRHTAGYVVFKDKMWLVGGDVNQGHYHHDVWNSTDGKSWTLVNKGRKAPWGPRALHYTLAFQDRIWVLGGQTIPNFAAAEDIIYRDIWTSADGVTWEKRIPREPCWSGRGMIGGSVVFRDRVWILGGGTYDTPKNPQRAFHNDVWSTADGLTWQRFVAMAPWEPRQYHDVAVFDGRIWVLEGYSKEKGNRNDVWYSADGVNWYELSGTPWKPRHAASVFVHQGALWMVAGNNMESDVWRLVKRPPNRP